MGYRSRDLSNLEINNNENGVIFVVDPFSTGAHLACAISDAGYKCGRIFSTWNSPVAALVQEGLMLPEFCATIQFNDNGLDRESALIEIINSIKSLPFPILAILPGAETGVALADALSHRLGLRSNGEAKSILRRNKYLMGEAVRSAGVRAIKQKLCTTTNELEDFLKLLGSNICVVKPCQSAGSDDVFLCNNLEEALDAFNRIYKKINGLGELNENVLVQEYIQGTEYVIDQVFSISCYYYINYFFFNQLLFKVSLDGKHKLAAVWEYDKRKVNQASFVYYGSKLINPKLPFVEKLVSYACKVLDALEINNGPSHMEVILLSDNSGPCLVEVGSRCQGGEVKIVIIITIIITIIHK